MCLCVCVGVRARALEQVWAAEALQGATSTICRLLLELPSRERSLPSDPTPSSSWTSGTSQQRALEGTYSSETAGERRTRVRKGNRPRVGEGRDPAAAPESHSGVFFSNPASDVSLGRTAWSHQEEHTVRLGDEVLAATPLPSLGCPDRRPPWEPCGHPCCIAGAWLRVEGCEAHQAQPAVCWVLRAPPPRDAGRNHFAEDLTQRAHFTDGETEA